MTILNPHILPKVRSDQIMASAAGQPCSLRISSLIPGHKCSGRETTIGAHLPVIGKGVSTKVSDLAVAYACFNCHALLDGQSGGDVDRRKYLIEHYPTAYFERLLNGLVETHARLLQAGIIVVKDGDII